MNYEQYGRSTASAQYFLQLAGYLGIPVIAWNADNSGLERVSIYNNWNKRKRIYYVSLGYANNYLRSREKFLRDVKEFLELY